MNFKSVRVLVHSEQVTEDMLQARNLASLFVSIVLRFDQNQSRLDFDANHCCLVQS